MRLLIILLSLAVFGCKTKKVSDSSNIEQLSYLSYEDYTPNPDEVVVSAKLISFESGMVKAEVIEQLKVGFSAKVVLNQGDMISLQSNEKPISEIFICAFEYRETMGNQEKYRVIRFLK